MFHGRNDSDHLGLQLLQDLIGSCVFLHDDWNDALGYPDWDQFDTNPILLGAKYCVTYTLAGFGEQMLDCLSSLGCLPANIVTPRREGTVLSDDLLKDSAAMNALTASARPHNLGLSTFYTRAVHGRIADQLRSSCVVPPRDAFARMIDKIAAWRLLQDCGVPTPEATICDDASDVSVFFKSMTRRGVTALVLKHHHRSVTVIRSEADIAALNQASVFPVLAEAVYPVAASPVAQAIRWRGRMGHLFTLTQKVTSFKYLGATTWRHPQRAVDLRIRKLTATIIELMPDFEGVLGVDFIVTPDNDVFVVDVNPRFNSSTYPFYLLHRCGFDLTSVYATYEIIANRSIRTLSTLIANQSLVLLSRCGYGVLPFNPVLDFEANIVRKWSCLVVGRNAGEYAAARASLARTLDELLSLEK